MKQAVARLVYFVAGMCLVITLALAPSATALAGAAPASEPPKAGDCTGVKPDEAITGKAPENSDPATYKRLGHALKGTGCLICTNQTGRVLLPYGIKGDGKSSFWCFITGVLNYNAALLNLIAVGWVAWFGLQYALAMGDSGKQKAAKEAIIGIVTGVIFITLARFLLTILGGPANVS